MYMYMYMDMLYCTLVIGIQFRNNKDYWSDDNLGCFVD